LRKPENRGESIPKIILLLIHSEFLYAAVIVCLVACIALCAGRYAARSMAADLRHKNEKYRAYLAMVQLACISILLRGF
jgi:uncharacterized membrane protein YecN with MAPEG domain